MKKLLLFMCLTTLMYYAQAQQTYYWVGGTTTSSIKSNANWNTALNGSGTVRTVNGTDDILIFDGSNIGGSTPTTGTISVTVTSDSSSKFIFQNNVNVVFSRPVGGGGSGTLSLLGGAGGDDLIIGAGSSLTINSSAADGNVVMNLFAGATGSIAGNLTITGSGVHRLTSQTLYGLVFKSTAVCTLSTTPASSGYPFGSATQGLNNGIVFQSGSQLITSGTYSPMGGTSTHQAALMLPGSNYYIKATNAAATGSWASTKYFGNIYVQNGATFTTDGAILGIGNLTIDAGCTYVTHTSGTTPILGNLVVNGTLNSPAGSTNSLVFGGSSPQTLTGTGSLNVASLTICDNSDLTISNNINISNSAQINGKLNFGTSSIAGTGTFSSRVNTVGTAMSGNVVADSFKIGSLNISGTPTAPTGLVGLTVTGAGIPANTTVVGSSGGGFYIILSKPATITGTSVALTFAAGVPTLSTANPNGFDSTTGSVKVSGIKSFQAGTNYVVNAATTYPIGISSTAPTAMTVGNLTLNAPVTTNINTKVTGTLSLNSGSLTIRPTDTIRIVSGLDVAGAPFSASKYIITSANGANVGALRIDSFNTTKTFPIGTATNYLPVTLTPTGFMSYDVNVFQGATTNAMPTGTAFTSGQKLDIVDAVWNVNNVLGTGNTDINLNWTAGLEGASLSSVANNQIGISAYNGTAWTPAIATSANNSTNTVTATFATGTLKSFGVGKLGLALPAEIRNLSATVKENIATINWQSLNETALDYYVIERSGNGETFNELGKLKALNNGQSVNNYSFADTKIASGNNYYRIKMVNTNGSVKYSTVLLVKNVTRTQMAIYPNPVKAGSTCTVSFNANEASNITFRTINIAGQVIATKHANISKGLNVITVETNNNIPSGNYILSVIDENTQTTMSNLPLIIK